MCTYARTVFECAHQTWGRRLKLCTIGEDFRDGYLPSDCCLRRPHGLQSRRVPSRCDRCRSLDGKVALLRAKLDECRAQFLKRWPAYMTCTGAGATPEETKEEVLGDLNKIAESVESSEDEERDDESDRSGSDGKHQPKTSDRTKLKTSTRHSDGPLRSQPRFSSPLATIHEV
ncbi:NEDD8 [Purpureocillium lavendulum]|uniref:NEDD8 n=1 Tax=Purpureocillium lavendulum TaxID=1247861 RepID=A0AB34G2U1_9HYPO|nr:NEDD8 [Purpureocillium lavendulum]